MMSRFENREHAGKLLAERLLQYKNLEPVILALPRGGVPVAHEVATILNASLDVMLVKKIGAPGNEEFAIGAVTEDEKPILNQEVINKYQFNPNDIDIIVTNRIAEIRKRAKMYRERFPQIALEGRIVILVDDGLATGATMMAALQWLSGQKIEKVIVAVPVSSQEAAIEIKKKSDEFIALVIPDNFWAVGMWYKDFSQVSDDEVVHILQNKNNYKALFGRTKHHPAKQNIVDEIEENSIPFSKIDELDSWVKQISKSKIIMLGESTHGTKEFYSLRKEISKKLIRDYGYNFIAVEGDWPDCFKLNKYIADHEKHDSKEVVRNSFHRWPAWMWANEEISSLINWMNNNQLGAFYGLDVYSLFESLDEIKKHLEHIDSNIAAKILDGYKCFESYKCDEIAYAKSLLKWPKGCQEEVLANLRSLLRMRLQETSLSEENLFDVKQNARVISNAEKYYRSMITGGVESWNVRDSHMMDTLENLLKLHGSDSKAIVWAHNTHIGDYHATDMLESGHLNLGGLARERFGSENVYLLGFSSYQGEVTAGSAWGGMEKKMNLPKACANTYEDYFHQASTNMKADQFLVTFDHLDRHSSLHRKLGHRAVGVVYDPAHESHGNYVSTQIGKRYDGLIFVDRTTALKSLPTIVATQEFPETWPEGQ